MSDQDAREVLEEEAIRYIRATPSDVLAAYLPVLRQHAEHAEPTLRVVGRLEPPEKDVW